ncbi:hypothetical protein IPJ72_01420 [Candidatus Peregrinibacteria bacterium]|nr:MAG: hypothetical protein IPJ72_01420 [Candidatus Peregrinibacteria bacterium]
MKKLSLIMVMLISVVILSGCKNETTSTEPSESAVISQQEPSRAVTEKEDPVAEPIKEMPSENGTQNTIPVGPVLDFSGNTPNRLASVGSPTLGIALMLCLGILGLKNEIEKYTAKRKRSR